jgi:lipopolysaccharide transport system permease protein
VTSTTTISSAPLTPTHVVRPLAINTFRYLYRCALALKFTPALGSIFLADMYRQTVLGWWWLIIRALLPTFAIVTIFGHVSDFNQGSIPFGLYVFSGMLLWTLMATSMERCTRALRRSRGVQAKLAIPKLVIVIASTSIALVYFCTFVIGFALGLAFEYFTSGIIFLKWGWNLLFLPIPLGFSLLLAIGLTSFTSVACVFARDARMIVPLVTQLWFLLTPIIYKIEIMPPRWQFALLYLNPVAPLLEMLRWSLFGVGELHVIALTMSAAMCVGVFFLGARFLMRAEWILKELF